MAKSIEELMDILNGDEDNVLLLYKDEKESSPKESSNSNKKKKTGIKKIKTKEIEKPVMISHTVKVYLGYVNKEYSNSFNCKDPIAVHENKDLVKEYLEGHRYLTKEDYHIEKVEIPSVDVYTNYSNQYLIEYHGYFIPRIDTLMLNHFLLENEDTLIKTISRMGEIIDSIEGIKGISFDDLNTIRKSMEIMISVCEDPEKLEEFQIHDMIMHSFLYTNIHDYMRELRLYKEVVYNRRMYEYQIYKDEDDFRLMAMNQ